VYEAKSSIMPSLFRTIYLLAMAILIGCGVSKSEKIVEPKVMIITGFSLEREIWSPLNLTNDFAIPGFLSQYKNVSYSGNE
jgi:purine nucleoside permease